MAPERVAGRYVLQGVLGQGGGGVVHRALDTLTGDQVALKRVAALSEGALAAARREVTALRWARLPGVVGLRDDGVEGGCWFLVMERVEGAHFPGGALPRSWPELAPVALRLLEILSSVHFAGLVHRDLKPSNVLVEQGTGRVVVLDFGLAREPRQAVAEGMVFEGTPLFAAPEQIAGEALDARTDLYAVGVMLHLALSGGAPHVAPDTRTLLARKLSEPARSLVAHAPGVPGEVARAVDRLLARDPGDRPASANQVIAALGGPIAGPLGTADLGLPVGRAATQEELRGLFHGPEHFLHLQSDGAAALYARTGGESEACRLELGRWVREGRGVWDAGALRIGVPALRVLGGADDALERTLALGLARAEGDLIAERRLLVAMSAASLEEETRDALEVALYELGRSSCEPGSLAEVEAVLRARRAALHGQWERCGALLEGVGPQGDEALEIWRQATIGMASRAGSEAAQETTLEDMATWAASSPERAARRQGWLGKLRYRQGLYARAADCHVRSAALRRDALGRARSLDNAAAAYLEDYDLARAERSALQAIEVARGLRLARLEASLTWILRTVAYRREDDPPADQALVDAAGSVSVWAQGALALNESALAFRGADEALCRVLAVVAERALRQAGQAEGAALAGALALLHGAAGDAEALAGLGRRARDPGLGAQILALTGWATGRRALLEMARVRVDELAAAWPGRRLDVLSPVEAGGLLPPRSGR